MMRRKKRTEEDSWSKRKTEGQLYNIYIWRNINTGWEVEKGQMLT